MVRVYQVDDPGRFFGMLPGPSDAAEARHHVHAEGETGSLEPPSPLHMVRCGRPLVHEPQQWIIATFNSHMDARQARVMEPPQLFSGFARSGPGAAVRGYSVYGRESLSDGGDYLDEVIGLHDK